VTRLLVLNSPINHRESGFQATPFIKAALEGHIEVVALLANRGGDIEARTTEGEMAHMLTKFWIIETHLIDRRED
jgi:ankyrin repeat protein